MTEPAAAVTPAPVSTLLPGPGQGPTLAPIAGAPAVTEPTPGWKTSEAWITMLVIVLGGLLSSGLVGEMSQLGKLITFGLTAAKAFGYVQARTSLKRAHAAAYPAAGNDNAGERSFALHIGTPTAITAAMMSLDGARRQLVRAMRADGRRPPRSSTCSW